MSENPLSPHLQIYRLPLTVILSIIHRITGFLLALGMVVLVSWLLLLATDVTIYEQMRDCFSGWFGKVLLISWTAALYFHLCNGIRHLIWDMGYGFDLRIVDISAVAGLLMTIGLTAMTWFLAWNV